MTFFKIHQVTTRQSLRMIWLFKKSEFSKNDLPKTDRDSRGAADRLCYGWAERTRSQKADSSTGINEALREVL